METSLTERAMARQVQGQRLAALATAQEKLEVARVHAAYRQLVANVHFQVLRDYWMHRYMLQPILTEEDRGRHNFLVQMLAEMREAGAHEVVEAEGVA
jgi:hypothetical protein